MTTQRNELRGRFDLEADGLLDTATKVHCLSVNVGNKTKLFVGKDIPKGLALLDTCDVIVAHNGIGFDLILLHKKYGWKPKAKIEDTLTMSCLMHADILGGHSLEAWGERLGFPKMDYLAAYKAWAKVEWEKAWGDIEWVYQPGEEWTEYNPVMGEYCCVDTDVLCKLDDRFLAERKEWNWEAALHMELAFAKDFAVQGLRGVKLDVEKANKLIVAIDNEMAEIAAEVEPVLPERPGTKGQLDAARPPKLCFKKNGSPTATTLKWFTRVDQDGHGNWIGVWEGRKWKLPTPMEDDGSERKPLKTMFPMKLADQQDMKTWLMNMGWKPTMWSFKKAADKYGKQRFVRDEKGQLIPTWPKFHDKGELCPNLEAIESEFEHVKKVVRWIVIRHRRGLVQSVLNALRPDGRVSATGFALGTPTSRVTHSVVANVPKAEEEVVLGKECRELFCVPKSRRMVGVDARGLELRMLAHYVGKQALIDTVVNGKKEDGTEIHTMLWNLCKPLVPSRTIQKNVTYAWLYGASDKKIGQTAGHPDTKAEKIGKEIRRRMLKGVPGLEDLMKRVERSAKDGYVRAIDGRKIATRSPHSTLNTLLQSAGSILVKNAQCYMNAAIRKRKLKAWQVISYHDEVQLECHPDDAQDAGQLFIEGLKWAGRKYNIQCPLDGEVKIGMNWAETH